MTFKKSTWDKFELGEQNPMQKITRKLFPDLKTDLISPEIAIDYIESQTDPEAVDWFLIFDKSGLDGFEELLAEYDADSSFIEGLLKELYKEARAKCMINPEKYEKDYAKFLEHAGEYFLDREEFSKAEKYLFEALNVRKHLLYIGMDAEPNSAILLSKLAAIYIEMRKLRKAESIIEEIYEIIEKWKDCLDTSFFVFACECAGMHNLDAEEYEKAIFFLENAAKVSADANIYYLLGNAYKQIESSKACEYLLKSVYLQYLQNGKISQSDYEILEELINHCRSADAHIFYLGLLYAEGLINADVVRAIVSSIRSDKAKLILKALNGNLTANDFKNLDVSLEAKAVKKLAMKVNDTTVRKMY